MGAEIGIDLGETNTVAAFTADGTSPRMLLNCEWEMLTPSVVAQHRDGRLVVGSTAARLAKSDAQTILFCIRRQIGTAVPRRG